jgi:hypothetical protein
VAQISNDIQLTELSSVSNLLNELEGLGYDLRVPVDDSLSTQPALPIDEKTGIDATGVRWFRVPGGRE